MVTGVITHKFIELAVATEFNLLENILIEILFLSPKCVKTEPTKVLPGKKTEPMKGTENQRKIMKS